MKERVWKKRQARVRRAFRKSYVWFRGWDQRHAWEVNRYSQDYRYVMYRGKKIFLFSGRIPYACNEAAMYIHETDNELNRLEETALEEMKRRRAEYIKRTTKVEIVGEILVGAINE